MCTGKYLNRLVSYCKNLKINPSIDHKSIE